jgi:hypothetical protein
LLRLYVADSPFGCSGARLFGRRVAADVKAIVIERRLERAELSLRRLDLALADLSEVARRDVSGEEFSG